MVVSSIQICVQMAERGRTWKIENNINWKKGTVLQKEKLNLDK